MLLASHRCMRSKALRQWMRVDGGDEKQHCEKGHWYVCGRAAGHVTCAAARWLGWAGGQLQRTACVWLSKIAGSSWPTAPAISEVQCCVHTCCAMPVVAQITVNNVIMYVVAHRSGVPQTTGSHLTVRRLPAPAAARLHACSVRQVLGPPVLNGVELLVARAYPFEPAAPWPAL